VETGKRWGSSIGPDAPLSDRVLLRASLGVVGQRSTPRTRPDRPTGRCVAGSQSAVPTCRSSGRTRAPPALSPAPAGPAGCAGTAGGRAPRADLGVRAAGPVRAGVRRHRPAPRRPGWHREGAYPPRPTLRPRVAGRWRRLKARRPRPAQPGGAAVCPAFRSGCTPSAPATGVPADRPAAALMPPGGPFPAAQLAAWSDVGRPPRVVARPGSWSGLVVIQLADPTRRPRGSAGPDAESVDVRLLRVAAVEGSVQIGPARAGLEGLGSDLTSGDHHVWPDNETDIDLLGFEFLVDGLVIALSIPCSTRRSSANPSRPTNSTNAAIRSARCATAPNCELGNCRSWGAEASRLCW
jgi:hypothetical protein